LSELPRWLSLILRPQSKTAQHRPYPHDRAVIM